MGNPVENLMLTDLPLPSPVRQLTDDAEGAKCLVEIFHTMLRGLHFDRYAFPLSAIRSSQGRQFLFRVTRLSNSVVRPVGVPGGGACVRRQVIGRSARRKWS